MAGRARASLRALGRARAPPTRHTAPQFPGIFTGVLFGNHWGTEGAKESKPDMCKRIGAVTLIDDATKYVQDCAEHMEVRSRTRARTHAHTRVPAHCRRCSCSATTRGTRATVCRAT